MILVDSARSITKAALGSLSDTELDTNLKKYRCNSQAAAMMAHVGDIHLVPDGCGSSFSNQGVKVSLFNAWKEVYRAALEEFESRNKLSNA